jgi:hypothetical protein
VATIDPRIALSYQNAQVPDPIDVRTRAANLKTIANQQQIQQGDITALGQENQARQKALDDQKAIDAAISQNTSADPVTQAPIINHNGVVSTLTRGGQGALALKYQAGVTSLQQADTTLKEAQDKLRSDHIAHLGATSGAVLDADPSAQPFVYQRALKQWIAAGDLKPGELPDQWGPEAQGHLTVLRKSAMTAAQQSTEKYNQGRIDAAEERANAAVIAAERRANSKRFEVKGVNADGYAVVLDNETGKLSIDKSIAGFRGVEPGSAEERERHDRQMEGAASRRGDQADARNSQADARIDRQDQAQVDSLQTQEATLHKTRLQLGKALKDGYFVDRTGKASTFEDEGSQRSDMQARYEAASDELPKVIAQKNAALIRQGKTPKVSTAQATAALAPGSGAAQPQAAGAPQYLKFANGPGARLGFNKATRKWEPIQK